MELHGYNLEATVALMREIAYLKDATQSDRENSVYAMLEALIREWWEENLQAPFIKVSETLALEIIAGMSIVLYKSISREVAQDAKKN